jgi:hypothetical protein
VSVISGSSYLSHSSTIIFIVIDQKTGMCYLLLLHLKLSIYLNSQQS